MTGVVVVGGSLAGLSTVTSLRRRGYEGRITLVGEELERPYDRPPLSKDFLEPEAEPAYLCKEGELDDLDIHFMPGTRATGVDLARRRVTLSDGHDVSYGSLVVATGAKPRTLQVPGGDLAGIHTLRTLGDAHALRSALATSPAVAIVGGGFIGAEFASAAIGRGLEVTILERAPEPFALSLGNEVGRALGQLHTAAGIRLRTDVVIREMRGSDRVESVALEDGTTIDADLVLVGIGVVPSVDWLDDSGLALDNGVICDTNLRSTSHPDVFAAGDVARWPHPLLGRSIRVEHWTNAIEHGDIVAAAITGSPAVADSVPYVWSDQLGIRIQVVGRPEPHHQVRLYQRDETVHAALWSHDGVLTGALAIGSPRLNLRARKAIAAAASVEDFAQEQQSLLA